MNSCELVKNHTYFTKWLIRTNVYELVRTNSCDLWKIARILWSCKFVGICTKDFDLTPSLNLTIAEIVKNYKNKVRCCRGVASFSKVRGMDVVCLLTIKKMNSMTEGYKMYNIQDIKSFPFKWMILEKYKKKTHSEHTENKSKLCSNTLSMH